MSHDTLGAAVPTTVPLQAGAFARFAEPPTPEPPTMRYAAVGSSVSILEANAMSARVVCFT